MSAAIDRTDTTATPPVSLPEDLAGQTQKPKSKGEQVAEIIGALLGSAILVTVLIVVIRFVFFGGSSELQIYASVSQDSETTTVSGHVLEDWKPASNIAVTVIASATGNNEYALDTLLTDEQGAFAFKAIPTKIAETYEMESVRIHARGEHSFSQKTILIDPNTNLTDQTTKIEPTKIAGQATLWGIISYFLFSIVLAAVLPLFRIAPGWIVKAVYILSLILAVGFAFVIIFALYNASERISKSGSPEANEVVTLGFMNIYRTAYLEDGPQDFFLSLTSPPPQRLTTSDEETPDGQAHNAPRPNTQATFGAPLWVVVLSVIGAAFLTVLMVIKEIGTTLDIDLVSTSGRKRFRRRIQNIVQHQIFILFAPLGGIFLFQMMKVGKAAGEPVTVALVALGAGATLNLLMAKAVKASQSWLEKSEEAGEGGESPVLAETPGQDVPKATVAPDTSITPRQTSPKLAPGPEVNTEAS